jgi:peptide-methionine (S)-S-oxide reductase
MAIATFAAGCFWHVEETFRHLDGVLEVFSGYTDGTTVNPTYQQVCADNTGHAEAVQIEYNPQKISYEKLLDVFWQMHDPTTWHRQGPDVGSQYRSAIFFHTTEQEQAAIKSKQAQQQKLTKKIVTEIKPASTFYKAEEYHQRYLEKHGHSACGLPGKKDN